MTCVHKEYEVKIKMVQQNYYLVGGPLVREGEEEKFGGGILLEGILQVGANEQIFDW